MNATLQQLNVDLTLDDGQDALSSEPEKRSVELAFAHRLVSGAPAVAALNAAQENKPHSFSRHVALMRSSAFTSLAEAMQAAVPDDADFGPWRGT